VHCSLDQLGHCQAPYSRKGIVPISHRRFARAAYLAGVLQQQKGNQIVFERMRDQEILLYMIVG
jgi:phage FluMu protein gp41